MEFKRDCGIDEKGAQQSRNIRTWLKNKNAVHDIHIAYSTFYRWYQAYGKMNEKQAEKTCICQGGSYKKLRRRPFHGEDIHILYGAVVVILIPTKNVLVLSMCEQI